MKKRILAIGCGLIFGAVLSVNAACYEPSYPALECDTQGWDDCVNYPKKACKDTLQD